MHYLNSRKGAVDTATLVLLTTDLKNELFEFASSFYDHRTYFAIRVFLVWRCGEKVASVQRYSLRSVMASENKFLSCTFVDGFCVFHV